MTGHERGNAALSFWPAILLPRHSNSLLGQATRMSEEEWVWLARQAAMHGLAPMLFNSVHAAIRSEPAPGLATGVLRAAYKLSAMQSMQREAELRILFDALASINIRPTVFKGAALAYSVYPTPACRPMGDIDLWVTHAEMAAAVAVLEQLGYQLRENSQRPHVLTRHTDGEIQMVPTKSGQSLIELHWGVFPGEWLARTAVVDREGIRKRLQTAVVATREVNVLSLEDALIQAAVHVAIGHQMSESALRSLVDVALMAEKGVDWDAVVSRAEEWRVAVVVGMVLSFAYEMFCSAELEVPAMRLRASEIRYRMLGKFVTPATILSQLQLSSRRSRFAYLLCLTDRPQDSIRLFFRSVWPEREWLVARYGNVGISTRAQHAANAITGKI